MTYKEVYLIKTAKDPVNTNNTAAPVQTAVDKSKKLTKGGLGRLSQDLRPLPTNKPRPKSILSKAEQKQVQHDRAVYQGVYGTN